MAYINAQDLNLEGGPPETLEVDGKVYILRYTQANGMGLDALYSGHGRNMWILGFSA